MSEGGKSREGFQDRWIHRILRNHLFLMALIFGVVFVSDQVTKKAIRNNMFVGESRPVFESVTGSLIRLTYVENPGIAFGIRVRNGSLFTLFSILASIGIVLYLVLHRHEGMGIKAGMTLILGGACGNLLDRILYQQVVDFVDVGLNNRLRWPVFNIADSAVVVGMVILFYTVMVTERKKALLEESA
ncbi:signal peptidase II [bacterium]|nr:signal peptidase II [bacterium]RQV98102.1 MAG: signal peptidase II [bacterium]